MKVNAEKLIWNWHTGRDLVQRKAEEKWGSGIVEQLSLDLQAAFPGTTGFGSSNLWYMKKWYLFYSEKLQRAVGEITLESEVILQHIVGELHDTDCQSDISTTLSCSHINNRDIVKFPQLFASVPWGQHIEIITRCKTVEEAVYYLKLTVAESLSRQALANCIKSDVFNKRGRAFTNFSEKLSFPQAKDDNPTIGLLICSDMRETDVQLSFRGMTTPLGVATYNNVQLEEIKRQLPIYDQLVERVRLLEQELNKPKA